ncbi:MAG: GNAT family N-acetyltransferase [Chloroflexi bacterium]|nr:GNAT family N-acetyltransferase [Chloroflexota bacterium]
MANIRPATQNDAAVIKKMVWDAGLDPTSLDWRHFLLAENEHAQIVGIGQIKEYPGCQELGSLVVLRAYRGQGIASALIAALEARAARPLYLLCQDRMMPYYRRFGYQQIGYWDAPPFLRLKLLIPLLFHLFGVRVVVMRKA